MQSVLCLCDTEHSGFGVGGRQANPASREKKAGDWLRQPETEKPEPAKLTPAEWTAREAAFQIVHGYKTGGIPR